MKYYKQNPIFVVSLFIGSGAGIVSPIWFILALVLNSKNNFIIAKLTIWVWCSYNEWTNCLQIAYMVKQLNYVWLTECNNHKIHGVH